MPRLSMCKCRHISDPAHDVGIQCFHCTEDGGTLKPKSRQREAYADFNVEDLRLGRIFHRSAHASQRQRETEVCF